MTSRMRELLDKFDPTLPLERANTIPSDWYFDAELAEAERRSVFAGWLYELDSIAVSVLFAQAGRWEHRVDLWHPRSHTSSKRFQIADFMYARRVAAESERSSDG